MKLHDFGISRISNDATGLSSEPHGHYRYQAPEVWEELAKKEKPRSCATAKSDIFAFGCILYEVSDTLFIRILTRNSHCAVLDKAASV